MSELKMILEKMYTKGKSWDDLMEYAQEQELSNEEAKALLQTIHSNMKSKRMNTAYRDLLIALLSLSYALYWTYLIIFKSNQIANALYIVSLFLWIPFLKSYVVVRSNMHKFDNGGK